MLNINLVGSDMVCWPFDTVIVASTKCGTFHLQMFEWLTSYWRVFNDPCETNAQRICCCSTRNLKNDPTVTCYSMCGGLVQMTKVPNPLKSSRVDTAKAGADAGFLFAGALHLHIVDACHPSEGGR